MNIFASNDGSIALGHVDVPNYMPFATVEEIADVDWGRVLRGIAASPVSLVPFLYVTKAQYGQLVSMKRTMKMKSSRARVYSPWRDGKDVDAVMASYLVQSSFDCIGTLPKDAMLHLLVVSGDSDFLPAINLIKQCAKRHDRKVYVTVASRSASTSELIKCDELGIIDRYVDLSAKSNQRDDHSVPIRNVA